MGCCAVGRSNVGLAAVLGAVAGLAFGAGSLVSASDQPEHSEMAQPEMSQDEMMAEMMRIGQPGEHHEKLNHFVGNWDVHAEFIMPEGSMTSKGTLTSEWVLNGRFVKGDFHLDDMMGMPFDGVSYVGYDNAVGQYSTIWMDSMSTKIGVQKAHFEGDSFVQFGQSGTGGEMKIVATPHGHDKMVDKFYEKDDEGEWFQSGTITYTRK